MLDPSNPRPGASALLDAALDRDSISEETTSLVGDDVDLWWQRGGDAAPWPRAR